MTTILAISEQVRQGRIQLPANGPQGGGFGQSGMTSRGRKTYKPKGAARRLHLGEWLDRLGIKQTELAAAVGITDQYVSELVSPKKIKKPTPDLLLAISEFLGITVNDLYSPPPSRAEMERAKSISATERVHLARLLAAALKGEKA